MIRRILIRQKLRRANVFVEPDEIFLDSKNLANFDSQQFEGRIEKPITRSAIYFLGGFFILLSLIFISRLIYLQIVKGEVYFKRSESNKLEKVIIFADRGIIYDRNKFELAWNTEIETETEISLIEKDKSDKALKTMKRSYLSPGFSHILGYVSSPAQDKKGKYWQTDFVGKDGLEKIYSDRLKGENGAKVIEVDALGRVHSENIINTPKRGAELITTLDSRLQKEVYSEIKTLADTYGFKGGAGVMMDVTNGEVIFSTSFPEYDGEVLSAGQDQEKISAYFTDKRKVFLDRAISGLYTPGSIVKPFLALAALNEEIISPQKEILSTGSISVPNPFNKGEKTVFKDWKAHGFTDMERAIAVSSDVYFYTIGGGFGGQKGLGISNIEKYTRAFGIGEKTGVDLPDEISGVIPNPEWKIKNFKGDIWRIGDTYHTAIGQYGFQVTPMEMVRATAAIANRGTLLTPHFILGDKEKELQTKKVPIEFKEKDYDVIHRGMRKTVTEGIASNMNIKDTEISAKTGTAQLGVARDRVNSWVIGFFPSDKPKYAFAMMMESGPSTNGVGASFMMRQVLNYMSVNTPEYFK